MPDSYSHPAEPPAQRAAVPWRARLARWLGRRLGGLRLIHADALAALRRSEARLRLVEQVARVGSFEWNPASGELLRSDEHHRLWGLEPGSGRPDGRDFRAGVHPQDADALEAHVQHALRGGGSFRCTYRVCWPDGAVRTILARGEVLFDARGGALRMIGTVQDASDRPGDEPRDAAAANPGRTLTAAGDAIVASGDAGGERARYAPCSGEAEACRLLDAFPGPIACLDAGLRFTYANAHYASLAGVAPEAMIGRPLGEVEGTPRSAEIDVPLRRALAGETVVLEHALPANAQRGDAILRLTLTPGPDPRTGERVCYVLGTDISELRRAQSALAAAKREAERAGRARLQFACSMSHELRTPMNAVLGCGQLLEADPRLDASARAHVQMILRGGRQLLARIDDLLDLARVEAGGLSVSLEPVDVDEALAECRRVVQPLAAQRSIELDAPPPAAAGHLRTVLYIEDNPVNIVLMEAMLERLPGVKLVTANHPSIGLRRAFEIVPDLIMLDIQMPHMDGYEVLARLRLERATAAVPVIAVSASAVTKDPQRGGTAGFTAYLTKPVDMTELVAAVTAALGDTDGGGREGG